MPEFRDRAFEIFLKDPDDYVKDTALSCWCNYFRGTKNKNILIKLYQILNNDNYSKSIRYTAYYGIFETIEARGSHADNLKNFQQNPKYQGL